MPDPSLMMSNEAIIHLKEYEDFMCAVRLYQEDLDGLNSLIHWLDGYSSGSDKAVPGHYELSVVYRKLRAAHNAKHVPQRSPSKLL